MSDVETFRDMICQDKKYAKATHNIFAYRFTCPRTGMIDNPASRCMMTPSNTSLFSLLRVITALLMLPLPSLLILLYLTTYVSSNVMIAMLVSDLQVLFIRITMMMGKTPLEGG